MRLASLLGVVILATGVHHAVAAELGDPIDRWVAASEPTPEYGVYFDALNVRREGKIVTYWERDFFKTPQRRLNGDTYVTALRETSTECGANWTAVKTVILLDEHDKAVSQTQEVGPQQKLKSPSSERNVQIAACAFDRRIGKLRSEVIDRLGANPQWTPLGEIGDGATADVSHASVHKDADRASAVVRINYSQARSGPDGDPFSHMYVRFDIDCGHMSVRQQESDYTDENDRLTGALKASSTEPFAEVRPGQPGEPVVNLACGKAPSRAVDAGIGGVVAAETWTYVATDPGRIQFSIDFSTIRQRGKYVESWQRQLLPEPKKLSNGKMFNIVLEHDLDDCAAAKTGNLDMVYTDDKGAVIRSASVAEDKVDFLSMVPESVGVALQARVCAYARRIAGLKPNFDLDVFAKTEWIPLGSSADYSENALARSTIRKDGSNVAYIMRSRAPGHLKNANGAVFKSTYAAWEIDCKLSSARGFAADFYDDSDQLVDVITASDFSKLPFTPIAASSPLAAAQKFACAAENAGEDEQTAGEASLYSGTAWLGPKGYLITASHVVKGATAILVAQDGKAVGEAEVVVDDPSNDVAILKPSFDKPSLHPLITLAPGPAMLGEHVFTLGYPAPDDLGLSVKLTSGEVSSVKGNSHGGTDDARMMQISTPIQHGNSGGPLFDDRGQAIGIIVSGFGAETGMQNVNYALKIAYVRSLLADLPDIGGYRTLKPSGSVTGLASDLRNSIFMLVVSGGKEK